MSTRFPSEWRSPCIDQEMGMLKEGDSRKQPPISHPSQQIGSPSQPFILTQTLPKPKYPSLVTTTVNHWGNPSQKWDLARPKVANKSQECRARNEQETKGEEADSKSQDWDDWKHIQEGLAAVITKEPDCEEIGSGSPCLPFHRKVLLLTSPRHSSFFCVQ